MTTIKLISFDQASQVSGYSLFVDNKWQYSRVIDLSNDNNTERRFKEMVTRIHKIINEEHPDFVAIEAVTLQKNAKTMMLLARLQGAIIGKCIDDGIQYEIIEPSKWRRVVGIHQGNKKREDLKKDSLALTHELFDKKLSEDAAESLLIGVATLLLHDLAQPEDFGLGLEDWD